MTGHYLRNGRFLALGVAVLVVAGLAALAAMPRTEDPRVLNRLGLVLTSFPGATAERVEALVSEPIENEMRRLPEAKTIMSTSRPGLSLVMVELKDSVTSTADVWSRARNYLDDVRPKLPDSALQPRFEDSRGYAYTLQVAITASAKASADLGVLQRYAKELEVRLRGVSGTDHVRIYGGAREEILVQFDAPSLSSLGVPVGVVANAILRADVKVAAGQLNNEYNSLQIEVAGELDSLERIRAIPIIVDAQGTAVRVGDVAQVRRSLADPAEEMALIHGRRGMVVAARMLPDMRVDRWRAQVAAALTDFRAGAAANVDVEVIFDQDHYTETRLGGLAGNVFAGFSIIVAVLLVTLGLRAALIVALALPLTALFTLACMHYWGLPIHQMSITGLIVALGIMVDNAIVMVDSIQHKFRHGKSALQAMTESIRHLWLPLLGSTLTTVLAFAPIALMSGSAGEFVGGIALSVMFSLLGSYFISHTIIAGLAGRLLKQPTAEHPGWLRSGLHLPWLARRFRAWLRVVLAHPRKTMVCVACVPLLGYWAVGHMSEQFFPPADRDMFTIELRLPPQTSIVGSQHLVEQVSARLRNEEGILAQHWFIGSGAPSFYYNMIGTRDGQPQFAQAMVTAKDFNTANTLIPRLQRAFDDAWPQAQILVRKLEQGPPFNAPLEVRIYGPSLSRLSALGDELRRVMNATPNVIHSRATLEGVSPKVQVVTKENIARQAGLELGDVAEQLQASLSGIVRGTVLEGTEELPVRLRVGNAERAAMADLGGLYITPNAEPGEVGDHRGLPLTALAEFEVHPARGAIPRRNGQRVNTIEGFLRADVLPDIVLKAFKASLQEAGLVMPAGYRLEYGGESSERNEAVGNLMANVGVILMLLIVVVVLSFDSFRLSSIIFVVAAQSVGLGILSVFACGYPFGFTVIVALMGLMGLAINAAIVILAELRSSPAACAGEPAAIVSAVTICARHITSTTITTVGGFLPLMIEGGGFWPPFAVAIAGGTVLTTLLSFLFVPAAFFLFAQRRAFHPRVTATASVTVLPRSAKTTEFAETAKEMRTA